MLSPKLVEFKVGKTRWKEALGKTRWGKTRWGKTSLENLFNVKLKYIITHAV